MARRRGLAKMRLNRSAKLSHATQSKPIIVARMDLIVFKEAVPRKAWTTAVGHQKVGIWGFPGALGLGTVDR